MKEQEVIRKALSLDELVLGFMRYAQMDRRVEDFPPFLDRSWQEFLYSALKELKAQLPETINVGFLVTSRGPMLDKEARLVMWSAFDYTAIVDRITKRIRLDTDGDVWGRELGDRFPEVLEPMFQTALTIRGFITFC